MKYAAIKTHAGKIGIARGCALLKVRRQGYYEWKKRSEGKRVRQDRELSERLKEAFYANDRIYGARKLIHILAIRVGRKRVRRLMEKSGLVPVTRRKRVNTTDSKHNLEIFPDLLKQNFRAKSVNRVWVSDFTYIRTDKGWLYLCTVLDLCSRRIVGWAVSDTIDRHLAIAALENAVKNRKPAKGFIFHSDRGCQYASSDFRNAVAKYKGVQSMSSKGCPYDNACAETFFKSLKVECLDRQRFFTRQQAKDATARYMLFYNRKRIHASLNYLCPVDFEAILKNTA